MNTYTQGERVRTPLGLGTVAYQRLAAPDYRAAAAVSVVLDSERARAGYSGTILPAADVQPAAAAESEPHTVGTVAPTPENDPIGRFRGGRS